MGDQAACGPSAVGHVGDRLLSPCLPRWPLGLQRQELAGLRCLRRATNDLIQIENYNWQQQNSGSGSSGGSGSGQQQHGQRVQWLVKAHRDASGLVREESKERGSMGGNGRLNGRFAKFCAAVAMTNPDQKGADDFGQVGQWLTVRRVEGLNDWLVALHQRDNEDRDRDHNDRDRRRDERVSSMSARSCGY
jgi:hypothetical protein